MKTAPALLTCALALAVPACGGGESTDDQPAVWAGCLTPEQRMFLCRALPRARLDQTALELSIGNPIMVDPTDHDRLLAIVRGELTLIDGEAAKVTETIGWPQVGYTFDETGRVIVAWPDKRVVIAIDSDEAAGGGEVLFELPEGAEFVEGGGIATHGDLVAVGVAVDAGYAVLLHDRAGDTTTTVVTSEVYAGQPAFYPDGARLAYVGPDYRSLVVRDLATGGEVEVSTRGTLSNRYTSPAWIDDARLVYLDAAPALVIADAATGSLISIDHFDTDGVFPVSPAG